MSRYISAGANRPNVAPIRLRHTVVTLSTAIQDTRSKDNPGDESIGNRITGASLATLVSGQIVTLSNAPNTSDWTMTAGRGFPV